MPKYPIKDSFVLAVQEGKKTVHKPVTPQDGTVDLTRAKARPLIQAGVLGEAAEETQ